MVIPQTEALGLYKGIDFTINNQSQSRFNTAEMGGMSFDIPNEAKVLVKRMTADPRVKIKEHWKVCEKLDPY